VPAVVIVAQCAHIAEVPSAERSAFRVGPDDRRAHRRLVESLPALNHVEVAPPPTSTVGPGRSVRVAAWNAERAKHLDASAALLASVGADVVLLSEMDLGMARSRQHHTTRRLAEALGYGHVFGVEFVELGLGDARERGWHAGEENHHGLHGGAVLSRWSLDRPAMIRLECDGEWLDGTRGERRIGGRIAVAGQLPIGGVEVAFVSVHFESHGDPVQRAGQMKVLLDAIDACHGDGPALIGGDFNTISASRHEIDVAPGVNALLRADPGRLVNPVSHEPLFEVAASRGYGWCGCNTAHATQRTRPDGTPVPPHGRLDWFFARGLVTTEPTTVAAVDAGGAAISDHELLAVTVAVSPEP